MSDFQAEKLLVLEYFNALEAATSKTLKPLFSQYMADDYRFYGCYPFNQIDGIARIVQEVWQPLYTAFDYLQRRQDIFMAGRSEINGEVWVMSMGHFMGLFDQDWLGMRASKKTAMLRYAEFHCVQQGKITKTGFFCDIIGLMHQLGLNPLPMQTGADFLCPGPRTHDGLQFSPCNAKAAQKTLNMVNTMIEDLAVLNQSGNDCCSPALLAKCWHQNMVWYGPAGIGTCYTIERYQHQHQYPFREGLKDKTYNGHLCRFAEGNYGCFFGWPNLTNTPVGGFLGLPGGHRPAHMRVVDVYRREGDKLVENWVLIDIPYWLKQQGLDILKRTASIANPGG